MINLSEQKLRELSETFRFYQIAEMYACDVRSISLMAAKYGIESKFKMKVETKEEVEAIAHLRVEGWGIQRIAAHIGRSEDFVRARVTGRNTNKEVTEQFSRKGWPKPTTTMAKALGDQLFDNVNIPCGTAINGRRLASAVRAHNIPMGCAADMCEQAS